jgi:hypothetical protein
MAALLPLIGKEKTSAASAPRTAHASLSRGALQQKGIAAAYLWIVYHIDTLYHA